VGTITMRRVIPLASSTCRAPRPRPVPFQVSAAPSASSDVDIDCDRADDLHGAVFFPGTSSLYFHALQRNPISIDHPIRSASFRVPDYGSPRDSLLPEREGRRRRCLPANVRPVQREDIIRATRAQVGLGSDHSMTHGLHRGYTFPAEHISRRTNTPLRSREDVHGVRGLHVLSTDRVEDYGLVASPLRNYVTLYRVHRMCTRDTVC